MLQATEKRPPVHVQHAVEDADTTLIHAAKHGDLDAFEQLLRRHQARVFRIARHITRSCEDAEEIAQETFLRAYQNLDRFEERSRFSTWLTRIAVNTALMKIRKRRGCEPVPPQENDAEDPIVSPQEIADWRPNPEQLYGRHELRAILKGALASLPQSHSTVFLLRDVEGFSTKETAEALGLTISTVKARLLRARLRLRRRLSVHFALPKEKESPRKRLRESPIPASLTAAPLIARNSAEVNHDQNSCNRQQVR